MKGLSWRCSWDHHFCRILMYQCDGWGYSISYQWVEYSMVPCGFSPSTLHFRPYRNTLLRNSRNSGALVIWTEIYDSYTFGIFQFTYKEGGFLFLVICTWIDLNADLSPFRFEKTSWLHDCS